MISFYKVNITCFDQSRLINLGLINKILLNKTETLSKNSLSIHGYHPIITNSKKKTQTNFINYSKEQSKELKMILFDYYQNYLQDNQNDSFKYNSKSLNTKKETKFSVNKISNKSEKHIILFLECLLSCNNIDNYNFELHGNPLEIELFNGMKWDIKQYEENNDIDELKIKFLKDTNNLEIGIKNNYNEKYYYLIKKITDIFPNNYHKLTKSSNKGLKKKNNFSFLNEPKNTHIDLSFSDNETYKLRIFKKFIFNEGLFSAAIVYNFLTKELRFMIKGIPEEIIIKCEKRTIPNDLEKIISFYRKKGFIVLVCATKLLDLSNYEDSNEELDNYMEDLTFCGLLTLENEVKDYVINSIEEIKKYNGDLIIISGDNEYNCLSTGYKSGIIEDKNIFILDKDENNNDKITIKKIASKSKKEEEETEIDIFKNTANDQHSRVETIITRQNTNQENNNDNKIIKNYTSKKTNAFNNVIFLENELNLPELNKSKINQNLHPNKRIQRVGKNFINENSEAERIIKRQSKNDKSINKEISEIDIKMSNKRTKEKLDKLPTNINNMEQDSLKDNNLIFMEKYYYHNSFKDYEDVKNGIFCISGELFAYIYENKDRKGVKKFMDDMIERCKIFFGMSSIDKSCLVDYYKSISSNNIVCTVGQCENDIDSLISSNIGISLKNPNNKNTILCHFYSSKNDIICLREIIENGRLFCENMNLLEYISFLYSIIINSFIFCCLLRDHAILNNELDFLEIELFVILITSFFGKINKENIYINSKSKLLKIYYAILCAEILLIKFVTLYFFLSSYIGDRTFRASELSKEFISFYFILCNEYILTVIAVFNFGSFYKENPFENKILVCLALVFIAYIIALTFFCSSNMSYDILNITYFLHNEKLIDSITDHNKLSLIIWILIDILATSLLCSITKFIFKIYLK